MTRKWEKNKVITQQLLDALQKGEEKTSIQTLFYIGLDFDTHRLRSDTVLSFAAEYGNLEIVEYMIRKGEDVNIGNSNGTLPLHLSAGWAHKEIVELFLKMGVDADSLDNNNCTPLHYVAGNSYQHVKKNKDRTGYKHTNAFDECNGRAELARCLVLNGANIDAANVKGHTPLLLAAKLSCKSMVEMLVKLGADVKFSDSGKWTILHYAAHQGWLDIVQLLLLDKRCNVNAKTSSGVTALLLAAENSRKLIVKLLIEVGAEVGCTDKFGWGILHRASYYGWSDIAVSLVGADVNAKTISGRTPLSIGVFACDIKIVNHLLKAGADCNMKDDRGNTPFNDLINNIPSIKDMRLFLENGAYIQPVDYDALMESSYLKEGILQNIQLCTQSVINEFNNGVLPLLYKDPLAAQMLPSIQRLKIARNRTAARDIEQSVKHEIETKGYCNLPELRPITLSILSINSYLKKF